MCVQLSGKLGGDHRELVMMTRFCITGKYGIYEDVFPRSPISSVKANLCSATATVSTCY